MISQTINEPLSLSLYFPLSVAVSIKVNELVTTILSVPVCMSVFPSLCLSESVLVCQSAFFSLIFVVVLFLFLQTEKEEERKV